MPFAGRRKETVALPSPGTTLTSRGSEKITEGQQQNNRRGNSQEGRTETPAAGEKNETGRKGIPPYYRTQKSSPSNATTGTRTGSKAKRGLEY